MSYRPEDMELDEGYWKALLSAADHALQGQHGLRKPAQTSAASSEPNADPNPIQPNPNHPPAHAQATARDRRPMGQTHTEPSHEEMQKLWGSLREAMQAQNRLDVEVTGVNRGGLIVHYHALRGFVPSSHLLAVSLDMDEPTRRGVLASHLGRKLRLRVIELEPDQDRVVLSEREGALPSDGAPAEMPAVLREIKAGETRHGKVTNLTAFGAFVDLGGYEGLVHVSELSWSRVGHPSDLLAIGQEVDVYVINADPSQGRIALSLKRARVDPWHGIEHRFQIGQLVHGIITNVVQFGAFAKVENDLEGLIHVSELADGSFLHPRNVVREGDRVTARVIGVDGGNRRLALSLRGVNGDE